MGDAWPHRALETAEHSTAERGGGQSRACGSQLGMLLTYVARGLSQKYLKMQHSGVRVPWAGGGKWERVESAR